MVIGLALLWLIFAHVVTFVFGLSLSEGKNLFARWMGNPAQQAPVPAARHGAGALFLCPCRIVDVPEAHT